MKFVALHEHAAFEFVFNHGGWHEGDAVGLAGHEAEHGHVVHLCSNDRADTRLIHEHVEGNADAAFDAGQNNGDGAEVCGKTERLHAALFKTDKADGLLIEQMTVPAGICIAAGGGVGEQDVEAVALKLVEKLAQSAGVDHKLHVITRDKRTEKAELKVWGEIGRGANAQEAAAAPGTVFQEVGELFAAAEYGVCVIEGDSSGFSEDEGFVLPFKKGLAEAFLQAAKLHTEGGLGKLKYLRSLGEAALGGDGTEVTEMVVV